MSYTGSLIQSAVHTHAKVVGVRRFFMEAYSHFFLPERTLNKGGSYLRRHLIEDLCNWEEWSFQSIDGVSLHTMLFLVCVDEFRCLII